MRIALFSAILAAFVWGSTLSLHASTPLVSRTSLGCEGILSSHAVARRILEHYAHLPGFTREVPPNPRVPNEHRLERVLNHAESDRPELIAEYRFWSLPEHKTAFLDWGTVAEAYRGQGFAQVMLAETMLLLPENIRVIEAKLAYSNAAPFFDGYHQLPLRQRFFPPRATLLRLVDRTHFARVLAPYGFTRVTRADMNYDQGTIDVTIERAF